MNVLLVEIEGASAVLRVTERKLRKLPMRCVSFGATCYRFDNMLKPLLEMAADLSVSLATEDRYHRFVAVARRMIPSRRDRARTSPSKRSRLRGEALGCSRVVFDTIDSTVDAGTGLVESFAPNVFFDLAVWRVK